MIKFKKGVKITGLKPEMIPVMICANEIFNSYNADCVITSALDGKHSKNSRHYVGMALDFRIRHLSSGEDYTITQEDLDIAKNIVEELKENLGDSYFVLLEKTHIHVQFNG